MSTGDDLLSAIANDPDDNARRLVYADWLEESGDADLAAFVRAQVEADGEPPMRRESPARKRVDRLYGEHRWNWVKRLPAWAQTLPRWRRGTLHSVQFSARNFLKHGPSLFRRHPTVHTVGFTNSNGLWPELVAGPAFAHVRGVEPVGPALEPPDVAALLTSPQTHRVESLTLRGYHPGRWETLGRPGVLPGLKELDLSHNLVGNAGATYLAAGGLDRLTRLSLWYGGVEAAGLRHLARAPFWSHLHHLDLTINALGDEGMTVLAQRPPSSVRSLVLRENDVSTAGVAALAQADLPHLAEVVLTGNAVGGSGVRPLLASRGLEQLYLIAIQGGPPDPALFRLAGAARLTDLSLSSAGVDDDVVKALAGSPRLNKLVYLNLGYNPWGNKGAVALAASPHLKSLATLVVEGAGVTDRGLAALRKRWGDGVFA